MPGLAFPAAVWAAPSKVGGVWVAWLVLAAKPNDDDAAPKVYGGTGADESQRAWLLTPTQWFQLRTSDDLALLVKGIALVQHTAQSKN